MSRCRCSSVVRSDWSFARSVAAVSEVRSVGSVLVRGVLQLEDFLEQVGGRRIRISFTDPASRSSRYSARWIGISEAFDTRYSAGLNCRG